MLVFPAPKHFVRTLGLTAFPVARHGVRTQTGITSAKVERITAIDILVLQDTRTPLVFVHGVVRAHLHFAELFCPKTSRDRVTRILVHDMFTVQLGMLRGLAVDEIGDVERLCTFSNPLPTSARAVVHGVYEHPTDVAKIVRVWCIFCGYKDVQLNVSGASGRLLIGEGNSVVIAKHVGFCRGKGGPQRQLQHVFPERMLYFF